MVLVGNLPTPLSSASVVALVLVAEFATLLRAAVTVSWWTPTASAILSIASIGIGSQLGLDALPLGVGRSVGDGVGG
jgi:hypothetical protein